MKSAGRTLVKSPPEVWDLIDQPDRMQGLMCALLGRATEVTVSTRKPGSVLRWQAADGEDAWIEVELAEKGWGTHVEVSAQSATEPTRQGWLDAVLDELATPQKRPFEGMDKPPAPVPDLAPERPAENASVEAPATEMTPAEPQPVEAAPLETFAAEPPTPEPPPARPAKKRRRLFGF